MPELRIEYWPVSRLRPYEKNPRRNDAVVPKMVEVLREFGFRIPILARSDGEVIDGHLRLKAALQMGWESVPVSRLVPYAGNPRKNDAGVGA
jgi:ParB-like chromosome segregation protein Spo0J